MWDPKIVIEEVTDPAEIARHREVAAAFVLNSNWLQGNWHQLLPQARGKILAVAGQEAFLADTPEEAWQWTKDRHPEDKGPLVRYVIAKEGPRIYVCPGRLAGVRRRRDTSDDSHRR